VIGVGEPGTTAVVSIWQAGGEIIRRVLDHDGLGRVASAPDGSASSTKTCWRRGTESLHPDVGPIVVRDVPNGRERGARARKD